MKIFHCCDCGAKVGKKSTKRCRKCYLIWFRGKNHHHFKGGKERFPNCIDCGKKLSRMECIRCYSCETKHKYSQGILNNKGNNNGRWENGISFELYPSEFNDELREKIRKRDNYECQNCKMTQEEHLIVVGRILSVHHVDYNKRNCSKENLITLCNVCNLRANYNKQYWMIYYQKILCQE